MKRLLILASVFVSFSCTHKTNPPALIPPPPPRAIAVYPIVHRIDSGADQIIKENSKLEEQLKEQKRVVLEQKIGLADAISQAEKMKNKLAINETITEMEMVTMVTSLKAAEGRNMFLEKQNEELSGVRATQEKSLAKLKLDLDEALTATIEVENELKALRAQNAYISSAMKDKNSEAEDLKLQLTKSKTQAATAGVYRNWIIIGVIGLVVIGLLKFVLTLYNPFSKLPP